MKIKLKNIDVSTTKELLSNIKRTEFFGFKANNITIDKNDLLFNMQLIKIIHYMGSWLEFVLERDTNQTIDFINNLIYYNEEFLEDGILCDVVLNNKNFQLELDLPVKNENRDRNYKFTIFIPYSYLRFEETLYDFFYANDYEVTLDKIILP